MHFPIGLVCAAVPTLAAPDSWPQVISLVLSGFALATALWKAAQSLKSLEMRVGTVEKSVSKESERVKADVKDVEDAQKTQASQIAELRRDIDRLTWRAEQQASKRPGEG